MSYIPVRNVILTFVLLTAAFVFYTTPTSFESLSNYLASATTAMSSVQGWHNRALQSPYPAPQDFNPTLSSLQFAVLRNAPVETEGFTLALFKSDGMKVAVDATGKVLLLNKDDFDGLVAAAQAASSDSIPQTGNFRNTWAVQRERTSQFIERLLVFSDDPTSETYKETSVQGFQKQDENRLKAPIDGFQSLPQEIADFFALALEAQNHHVIGNEDKQVIDKVKAILPQGVF